MFGCSALASATSRRLRIGIAICDGRGNCWRCRRCVRSMHSLVWLRLLLLRRTARARARDGGRGCVGNVGVWTREREARAHVNDSKPACTESKVLWREGAHTNGQMSWISAAEQLRAKRVSKAHNISAHATSTLTLRCEVAHKLIAKMHSMLVLGLSELAVAGFDRQ